MSPQSFPCLKKLYLLNRIFTVILAHRSIINVTVAVVNGELKYYLEFSIFNEYKTFIHGEWLA